MDEYRLKGLLKKYGNMFRNFIEKLMFQIYDRFYKNDLEFMINLMNIKNEMIFLIVFLNEVDVIFFVLFIQYYMDNIDVVREKGIVFFFKLL